jgi:hypothetical protein
MFFAANKDLIMSFIVKNDPVCRTSPGRLRNYLLDPDPQFEFRTRILKGSDIRFLQKSEFVS